MINSLTRKLTAVQRERKKEEKKNRAKQLHWSISFPIWKYGDKICCLHFCSCTLMFFFIYFYFMWPFVVKSSRLLHDFNLGWLVARSYVSSHFAKGNNYGDSSLLSWTIDPFSKGVYSYKKQFRFSESWPDLRRRTNWK